MAPERRAPLTNFLISLCHSPELLEQFDKDPDSTFVGSGLSDDLQKVVRGGNLGQIQDAVRAEHPETEAVFAAIWIGLGPIPGPWIFTSCDDEPPADEPPADEPPADEPPADEPPADEPPADEPPADEHPHHPAS
ncbi:MAG: hypothetical protein MSC30_06815 [Gaiellaceae bacterium MAG52_C11]|nr:hypothetical protein [Candidatus Gaiellasilicea maunaloa]